eukprot:CAMPEP_0182520264 /NCGR_PEP_ID=MMETSP1321-20130603/45530_1 /TAXON_ID=91990 /ORGANISM="Bolidomonas sp., Strain RCC1657" /LENGTH=59 /DNA_ID=CAMNT_0024728275 /DNA_START=705 /DNA_END=884 /DNA_ORIENTATION=-
MFGAVPHTANKRRRADHRRGRPEPHAEKHLRAAHRQPPLVDDVVDAEVGGPESLSQVQT